MPIYTNKFDIPEAIYNAIVHDSYDREGDYSATDLTKPPRMVLLARRHDKEIEIDVSTCLWSLLGKGVHAVLDKDIVNVIQEERLSINVHGRTITGKADLYHGENKEIRDYKVTSVWSYIYGDKPEWESQLNIYAYLFRDAGFEVERLAVDAILRDWMASKRGNEGYPPIPFVSIKLPLWFVDTQRNFIDNAVFWLKLHEKDDDIDLPLCTSEQRWARPDTFAIMKNQNKRSTKNFDNAQDAQAHAEMLREKDSKNKYVVEHRQGDQWVRCREYCNVNEFCNQYKDRKV